MLYILAARILFEDDVMPLEWNEMKRLEATLNQKFKIIARAHDDGEDGKFEMCIAGFGADRLKLSALLDDVTFFCESHGNHRVIDAPHDIRSVDGLGMKPFA